MTTDFALREKDGSLMGQDQRLDHYNISLKSGDKASIQGFAREMLINGMDHQATSNVVASILRASGANPAAIGSVYSIVEDLHKQIEKDKATYYVDENNNLQKRKIFSTAKELRERSRKPTSWLVKDFFELNAVSMIWGPPGSGKSFVALDIAACVSQGVHWNGHRVEQGAVFYFAGEGHEGIGRRLDAWTIGTGVDCSEDFFISDFAINMFNEEEAKSVVEEIRNTITKNPVKLVVIDTLARSMIGGDENSAVDMSKFMNILDRFLIKPLKINVMIIHHSGVAGGRYRGSTAIQGALDQEFEVTKDPVIKKFICHKMKDAIKPPTQKFELKSVYIDTYEDQWGDKSESTSAYSKFMDQSHLTAAPVSAEKVLTHDVFLEFIKNGDFENQEHARVHFGCRKTRIKEIIQECVALGLLNQEGRGKPELTAMSIKRLENISIRHYTSLIQSSQK